MSNPVHDFAAALEKASLEAIKAGMSYADYYRVVGGLVGYSLGNDARNTPQAIERGLQTFYEIAHAAAADRYAARLRGAA